ncbi:MAG: hypothetical protein ACO1QB_12780 [Verrucomicrobiales bacterium]
MKKTLMTIIGKTVAGVALVAAISGATVAKAANIVIETAVPGYRGYALVIPELRAKLGGRVMWDSTSGRYITDRVARGEQLKISVTPSNRKETGCRSGAIAGVHAQNGYFNYGAVRIPLNDARWKVSKDPRMDNVHLWVITNAGYFEKRFPIGNRPR